jgi:hypothetical protein
MSGAATFAPIALALDSRQLGSAAGHAERGAGGGAAGEILSFLAILMP